MEAIVGKNNVSINIYDRIAYAIDPMPYDLEEKNIPAVVVLPGSSQEISEILKYANKNKVPVYVHGSGTLFNAASRPKRKNSILMHTGRINFIKIMEEYGFFECGAGARCFDVEQILLSHGYMIPLNPGSKLIATMGGLVSINTIGHMVDMHVGKPADHILGLEVILPTGEIIETGTKSLRRPSGMDLTKFFIGTEGQFGVISKIRMKLIVDQAKVYVVGYFNEAEDVAKAFMRIYTKKAPIPLYGEFLDKETAEVGFKLKGLPQPQGCVAFAIITGRTKEDVMQNAKKVFGVFKDTEGFIGAETVEDPAYQQKVWGTRESILHLIGKHKGSWTAIEVAPALPFLAKCLHELKIEVPQTLKVLKNEKMYLYGHLGACSMHALWIIPKDWSNEKKKEAVLEALEVEKKLNVKYEGCGGELGQLAGRIPFFKERYGNIAYNLLLKLKKTFDPNNILNPGNLEGEIT